MTGYICIHGHFYQPPRENPWLERIEIQDSAYPCHDWNVRVDAECYAPNAVSRILDENGKITRIVNNYEKISFNFGPTLLAWMERHSPDVYKKILQADKLSIERNSGHGNAIAQAYNHIIMPLGNRRDRITQVIWGIRTFQKHFSRDPEGMWLPETAADIETFEILHEHGIRFTILSPRQAKRVRPLGMRLWCDVSNGSVDTTIPYLVRLPCGGHLCVFFYNGRIAHDVAFGGLLQRGEAFEKALLGALPPDRKVPPLVHIATDGETYGHHHRFGEMALAYAIDQIEKESEVRLTNYGEYLSLYSPTHEAEIFENSSWSCSHGIERWRADCGCDSGGRPEWNQAWRSPLRESLDWLRYALIDIYRTYSSQFLKDPWIARDEYVGVILERTEAAVAEFLKNHSVKPLNPGQKTRALQLMEMQRNVMLMYTSCGWFFDDISGIEAIQVLSYAARAIEFAKKFSNKPIEEKFLERLEDAKSNLKEMGTGSDIYRKFVLPSRVDLKAVAAHFAISSFFESYPEHMEIGCYTIEREDYKTLEQENAAVAVGRVHTKSTITEDTGTFVFTALHQKLHDYNCVIKPYSEMEGQGIEKGHEPAFEGRYEELAEKILITFREKGAAGTLKMMDLHFGVDRYSLKDLFKDEQKKLLDSIVQGELDYVANTLKQVYRKTSFLMGLLEELGQHIPSAFMIAAKLALKKEIIESLVRGQLNVDSTSFLLNELNRWRITLDTQWLEISLRKIIEKDMELFQENPKRENLQRMNTLVTIIFLFPVQINLWRVQNIYYEVLQSLYSDVKEKADGGDEQARVWLAEFLHLGQRLSIDIDEMIRYVQ